MKRGLVTLGADEHDARLDALRERLREAGVAVGLIYGDVSRSDDIAYLTNLCVYWNEGVLVVPLQGEPAFVTRLSKRVHPWMRATSTLRDLRSGPDLAGMLAELVGDRAAGLIDRAWWPAGLVRELEAALPGVVPLDAVVREARAIPSSDEVELLRRAGAILAAALDEATGTPPERIATVERRVRRAGFLDARVACDDTSIDAAGQLQHLWVRAARGPGADRLAWAVRAARTGATPADLARAAGVGELRRINHADLATGGDHAPGRGPAPLRAGEAVALVLELDGVTVADTLLVRDDGAEVLTANGGDHGRVG